jgi:uncharacterized phage-associated protein
MSLTVRDPHSNPFRLNRTKAIQATAFLLKQKHDPPKTDNFMRLLKLLYFADRESIRETGRPITGDKFVAMEHGPTLSGLLDFVKQQRTDNAEWDEYIERIDYEIRLVKDPGIGELSRYEINLLRKIWEENRELGEWDVATKSEALPEWQQNNPGTSSKPIPLRDVLNALGIGDYLEEIEALAAEDEAISRLFGAIH